MLTLAKRIALLMATTVFSLNASATVVFSENGNQTTLEVSNETYTLTAGSNQNLLAVMFPGVFPASGGNANNADKISSTGTISINGGPATPIAWWGGWQYRSGTQASWTPEDAGVYININPLLPLSAGDQITINATLVMDNTLNANIVLPSTPPSTTLLTDGSNALSTPRPIGTSAPASADAAAVPTLPTWMLFALIAAIGLSGARRAAKSA